VAHLAVIGAGYVGLVTAACLSEFGHQVTCIEVDETKLVALGAGELPIHEPGLAELVWQNTRDGRLQFTGDYARISDVDFLFIAVPTPPRDDGSANIKYVLEALDSLIPHARRGLVIIMKSTVPVGTADMIAQMAPVLGAGIEVVSNPEFLRQGTAVRDFLNPDRVVIGASSLQSAVDVARLYGRLDVPIVAVDRRSAELAKYTANALLATRISFMNEISHIAAAVNADVDDVARIVGMDGRIGPAFLKAGLGWGGSCFPKDVLALSSAAASNGCSTPILQAVYKTNELQREYAAKLLLDAVRTIQDPVVAVLGLAFKPNTDDVRGSPALVIAGRLLEEGVVVRVHDPRALANASRVLPGVDCCPDPYSALEGADALLLATEWEEYGALDWVLIRETMRGKIVLDGRNVLNRVLLAELGFRCLSVAPPTHKNGNGSAPHVDHVSSPPFGAVTLTNGNGSAAHEDATEEAPGVQEAGVE
jgi:UDPglucose 6-dehydrogenase